MKSKPKKPKHGNAGNKHAQRGDSPRVPLFVRVPPAALTLLKHQAAQRGLSQSDTVNFALNVLESTPMKTLKLKTSENSGGLATLQNCAAPVGLSASGSITYAVKGIPGGRMKTNDQRIYHVALHPNGKAFASFCGADAKRDATRAAGKTGSVKRATGADLERLMRR